MFYKSILPITIVLFLNLVYGATRYVSHKNCNNMRKGVIIANPANCSQYIMCNGLRSTLGECPEGFYYNADMLSCDKNQQQCNIISTTTTAATTTSTATTAATTKDKKIEQEIVTTTSNTRPPIPYPSMLNRPVCSSTQDHSYPHPYNCSYYYQCISGSLTVRRCYFGAGWDWLRQSCIPITMAFCANNARV